MTSKYKILVCGGPAEARGELVYRFEELGYEASSVPNGAEGMKFLETASINLLIADSPLPDMDKFELIRQVGFLAPQTAVLLLTDLSCQATVCQALEIGAADYLMKPFSFGDLACRARRALRQIDRESPVRRPSYLTEPHNFSDIIGQSPQMREVFAMIRRLSRTNSTVLITGPTGTGKDLVASAIHYNSERSKNPLVPVNCSAIPENLLESELFGHTKGAFTGAHRDKPGMFEIADGGTLFLDEVGEIPLHLQVKLLRSMEQKEIQRVGGTEPKKVNVRILAATNRDLLSEVEERRFREDLYYRLNVVEVCLPALADRKEDLPLLVDHFIRKKNTELKTGFKSVSNEVMRRLMSYRWKGNVRELENVIERAMILGEGDVIQVADLPPTVNGAELLPEVRDPLKEAVAAFEARHIAAMLERCDGDKRLAAEKLSISLSSLYRKIDELGVIAAKPGKN